jgi:hypothetical protein
VVNADHLSINRHPLSVLEVHRILLEHLAELDAMPARPQRLPNTMTAGAALPSGPFANGRPAPAVSASPATPASANMPVFRGPDVTVTAPAGDPALPAASSLH